MHPYVDPGSGALLWQILVVGVIGLRRCVYPPARGNAYAERSCRLLLPLARRHGLRSLWITCNPDNAASRRTCERLGAVYVDTLPIPPEEPLFARGETHKCRYLLDLRSVPAGG